VIILFYLILLLIVFFCIVILKKMNIKRHQILNVITTILILLFLYYIPLVCIKIFEIFCNCYDPQLSGYAFAVWYFIIYICVSLLRFIILFIVTFYGVYKQNTKCIFLKKHNLVILLITLIIDFIIYNFIVPKSILYSLSQNNVILYTLFYSVTIIYLPILSAFVFNDLIIFVKSKLFIQMKEKTNIEN
jgi:hypothetical protein